MGRSASGEQETAIACDGTPVAVHISGCFGSGILPAQGNQVASHPGGALPFWTIRLPCPVQEPAPMLPPGLQWLVNAADAFMRSLLVLFLFGLITLGWRQMLG